MKKKLVLVQRGTLWKNVKTGNVTTLNVSLKDVFGQEKLRQFEYSKDGKDIYLLIPPKKKKEGRKNGNRKRNI